MTESVTVTPISDVAPDAAMTSLEPVEPALVDPQEPPDDAVTAFSAAMEASVCDQLLGDARHGL